MRKQDLVSILITFVVGLVGGGYLYVSGFAEIASKVAVPTEEELSELSITADLYGGCKNSCSSFRVLSDGSYKVIRTSEDGEVNTIEGVLPLKLQSKMRNVLLEEELQRQSEPFSPTKCSSYTDGIDAVYEVTVDSNVYVIDSCGTMADGNSDLWIFLNELWAYFTKI